MATIGNAGVPIPIPDNFDFAAWLIAPASRPHDGIALRIRNRENVTIEEHNDDSKFKTIRCRDDRSNHPDVGLRLLPFYDYLTSEWSMMAKSEEFAKSVGPIPIYVRIGLDKIKEKEKTKGLEGSMVIKKPIIRNPGQRSKIAVPRVVCQSMACGIKLPLHFFLDCNLEKANYNIADLYTKLLTPEATSDNPNPHKVLVFDMTKMVDEWGDDDTSSRFTALKWLQASANLLRTLETMSEAAVVNKPTYHSEYKKHHGFFTNVRDFEDSFHDIYYFEVEARRELLNGTIFDLDHYARRVDSILDAKRAAVVMLGSKRPNSGDIDSRAAKGRRISDKPIGSTSSPRNSSDNHACLICGGAHTMRQHPASSTSFHDGKPFFSSFRETGLVSAKGGKPICIAFNLSWGCTGTKHGAEDRLHLCSLCGGKHGALSRSNECGRVTDGKFRL
jgi:hypothetical protein